MEPYRLIRRITLRVLAIAGCSAVGLVAGGVQAAGAWEVPNGAATAVSGFYPFADPAAAGYNSSGVNQQLYGTSIPNQSGGGGYNIPTENWVTVGGATTNNYADALYTPQADTPAQMYAPDVQFINGQYVMWYVGNPLPTQANPYPPARLENATSASAQGPFSVHTVVNSGSSYGLFDPYLWQDSGGNWWLFWAQENGTNHNANSIMSAELSGDGLGFASGAYTTDLVDFNSIQSAVQNQPSANDPQIENPTFITDPQGSYNYNMTMSFGDYHVLGSYRTLDIACDGPTGNCGWNTSQMNAFDGQLRGGAAITNSGGASFVESSQQFNEQYIPFAAVPSGDSKYLDRYIYADGDNSGLLLAGQSIHAGNPQQGTAFCLCMPNNWVLHMQTDGNLVIYDATGYPRWQSGTAGGDANSYAIMQSDGNFVVYDNGVARFQTHTYGNSGARLVFQNVDSNLVVYSSTNQSLWQSGTHR